jgi:FtsH-binding integral membrane protein
MSKARDQLLLLLAAIALIVGLYWIVSFMENRGIPDKLGFFIVFNILEGIVLTWQAVSSFAHTPRFWLLFGCWAIAHSTAYAVWGYSGYRIEFCVAVLPLEHYLYYRILRSRFRRLPDAGRHLGGTR